MMTEDRNSIFGTLQSRLRRTTVLGGLGLAALAAGLGIGGSAFAQDADVTLSYALWDQAQVPAMEQIIAEFRKEHPNIDVRIQLTPWSDYWTKLQTSATGGSAPDVFWMTLSYFQYYASGGALMPLDDKIAQAGIDMSNYVPSIVQSYTYDGKVFGMPKDVNAFGLFYNKDLFTQAGVAFPSASWTWEDVATAAGKLTNAEQGIYGIAAPPADELTWYLTIPQAGGSVLSADGKTSGYDSPEAIKGMQFWIDLIEKGVSPNVQQLTDTEPLSLFTSGKVAMYYGGSWDPVAIAEVPEAKAFTDVAPLPSGATKHFYSNGLANSIYVRTPHPEEAWEFVQFLSSQRANEIQSTTGTVIPAYNGMAGGYISALPWLNAQALIDQLPEGLPFPVSKRTSVWRQFATREFTRAFMGEIPLSEAAKTVAEQMNAALAEE